MYLENIQISEGLNFCFQPSSLVPTKLDYSIWLHWQYTLDCPSQCSK